MNLLKSVAIIAMAFVFLGCGDDAATRTTDFCLPTGDLDCVDNAGGNSGSGGEGGSAGDGETGGSGGSSANGGTSGNSGGSGGSGATGNGWPELCNNTWDDDQDGLIDEFPCVDPSATGGTGGGSGGSSATGGTSGSTGGSGGNCASCPTNPEICSNGVDDDQDGLTDEPNCIVVNPGTGGSTGGTGGNGGNTGGTGAFGGSGGIGGTGGNSGTDGVNCTPMSPVTVSFYGASQTTTVKLEGGVNTTLSSTMGVSLAAGSLTAVFAGDANDSTTAHFIEVGGQLVVNPAWASLSGGFTVTVSGAGVVKLYRFNPIEQIDVQWKWFSSGANWSGLTSTSGVTPNSQDPNPWMRGSVSYLQASAQAMRCAPLVGQSPNCWAYQSMQPATLLEWVADATSTAPQSTGPVDGDTHWGLYVPPRCP